LVQDGRYPRKTRLAKGATRDWEVVVEMEVHAQVSSQSKLFSGDATEIGGEANARLSLVDAAISQYKSPIVGEVGHRRYG
jgi:aspartyl-tRNA(Asn)/glutamyl-tRNA(Gln) amidotransferase subunit B